MILQVNESQVFIIEKIYRDYLNGIPHFIIHKEVKKLGFPHNSASAIFRALNNPLYCGLVRVCAYGKLAEKLVKGVHEAIIPESLYYRVQDKLKGNKREMKSKPKDEFPLKGIIKSSCCGRNLTAGWSTGKLKKYMYYRCLDHSNVNISGIELHEKFEELLRHLSFTKEFVDEFAQLVSGKVKEILKSNENRLKELRQQLQAIEVMIANIEQKLFSDVINDDTYKRNMQKFKGSRVN